MVRSFFTDGTRIGLSTQCFTYKDFIRDDYLENTAKRQRLFP